MRAHGLQQRGGDLRVRDGDRARLAARRPLVLGRERDVEGAVRHTIERHQPLGVHRTILEVAEMALDGQRVLEQRVGAAVDIARGAEGAHARAVDAHDAHTLGADVFGGVEVGGRPRGTLALERRHDQARALGHRLVVLVVVTAPVENGITGPQRTVRALDRLDHVFGDDRALAVFGLIERATPIDFHDLAQPLPDRNAITGQRAPVASIRQAALERRHHVRRAVDLIGRVLVDDQEVGRPGTVRSPFVVRNDDRLFVAAGPPLHAVGVDGRREIDDAVRSDRVVRQHGRRAHRQRERNDEMREYSRAGHPNPPRVRGRSTPAPRNDSRC